MTKRFFCIAVSILFIITLLNGCSNYAAKPSTGEELPSYDRAGYEINVPAEINSIVSMVPAITLSLIDLGLEDKIIGMDTNSAALLETKPDMPVFDMFMPDAESLAALKPDIILASSMSMMGNEDNDPFAQIKNLGICVAYIPTSDNIDDIKEDLRFIAAITKRKEKGEQLIADFEKEMGEIAKLKNDGQPDMTVYFEIAAAPSIYSFGNGVYQNEMLQHVGLKNIYAKEDGWINAEAEYIVSANPDIIFTNVNYIDDPVSEIMSRPGWEEVNAVKNNRVYYVENSLTALPYLNIAKGMRAMAEYAYEVKQP